MFILSEALPTYQTITNIPSTNIISLPEFIAAVNMLPISSPLLNLSELPTFMQISIEACRC